MDYQVVFKLPQIDKDAVAKYVEQHRRGTAKETLAVMYRLSHFCDAWNNEVGYEILKDAVSMHYDALMKCATFQATDEDKARLRVLDELISAWSSKIGEFIQRAKTVQNG
jgi:hypothetical protein